MSCERELTVVERIGLHSHIKGLGVDLKTLNAFPNHTDGIIGQTTARRAAAVVIRMLQDNRISGRAVIIHGSKGTGKTAIAKGMSMSLGAKVPFVTVSAGEFYSSSRSKAESIAQMMRKAVFVEMIEKSEIVEGEVVELIVDSRSELNASGKLTIKTTDMEAVYDLGYKVTAALIKERVSAGDIISIDRSLNKVTKKGRSITFSKSFDAIADHVTFLPCPEGELQKSISVSNYASLHDVDIINSNANGGMALFAGDIGEVKSEVRAQINEKVSSWIKDGKAKIKLGVLFIDEIYMLDAECYSCLNRFMESEFAPIVILTSNKAYSKVRGCVEETPLGVPADFFERSVVIATEPYSVAELREIVELRASEERINASGEVLQMLATLAAEASLRFSMQILTASDVIRGRKQDSQLLPAHMQHALTLFHRD